MVKPICIDLFAGLGGWSEGFLAEGYQCWGFDVERHRYPARVMADSSRKVRAEGVDFNNPASGSSRSRSFNYANECALREAPLSGGWDEYPGDLVLQDVLTLHGSQFKDATVIVASPPCQKYSYMAMPWSRAKQIRQEYLTGVRSVTDLTALFDACFRIQREAIEAAGRFIPLIVENVRGAQEWVGRSRWHFGSFHLWGDVPALMPFTYRPQKHDPRGYESNQGSWFNVSMNDVRRGMPGVAASGRKLPGNNGPRLWRDREVVRLNDGNTNAMHRVQNGNGSGSRKAASAQIAKIPFALSSHIAKVFKNQEVFA